MKNIYIVAIIVVLFGAVFVISSKNKIATPEPIACSMIAKLCPDGTAVGRTGPNCEFAPCPDIVPSPQPNQNDVVVSIGQKGIIGDLSILVNSLAQDSRCPVDVQCIWAGALKVNVTIADQTKSETREMTLGDTPYLFDGHDISITKVLPSPKSKTPIAVNEYRITFHVVSVANTSVNNTGIITGRVTLSPTCPVERIPPDPQCAPKPYQTKIDAFDSSGNKLIKTTETNADGVFTLTLPFGDYTIQAGGGTFLPRCSPVAVHLASATSLNNIFCDTGIR